MLFDADYAKRWSSVGVPSHEVRQKIHRVVPRHQNIGGVAVSATPSFPSPLRGEGDRERGGAPPGKEGTGEVEKSCSTAAEMGFGGIPQEL